MNRAGFSRRFFLSRVAVAAAATSVGGSAIATSPVAADRPVPAGSRPDRLYAIRMKAAQYQRQQPVVAHRDNGDEARYARKWGSYSKGLPHDPGGEVNGNAYATYLDAVHSTDSHAFERIPLGGYLKLANPQAAYAFDLVGPDSAAVPIAVPPAFSSAEQASELAEMYWHAVLRDVPFGGYDTSPLVAKACAELSAAEDFRGPKEAGRVTPRTLFRGFTEGGQRGPYVSQFLLRDVPMTPIRIPQKIRTAVAGRDFMTAPAEWAAIQNGGLYGVNTFDSGPKYLRNGRDLGELMHRDFTYQTGLCAAMILLRISAPLDGGIPYQYSITQSGFVTFGASDILHLVSTIANLALKACWYQKWIVHRRARPEELGGRVHAQLARLGDSPLHRDILGSEAVQLVRQQHGSYLLPQAYPEGCPSHPAYPSGHAVIAGACSTVLKAVFNESWVLPQPVVAADDGESLQPYRRGELTVGGELDKLAENVAFGRNFAGIHWRTDGTEGIRFGEEFAIRYLREAKLTSNEFFHGFSLTRFDGTRITI